MTAEVACAAGCREADVVPRTAQRVIVEACPFEATC